MMTPSRSRAFLPGHDEDCNCYGCEELRLDGRQRKRRPSDASDMDLDELITSQDKGTVPGDAYRRTHENPVGLDPRVEER